MSGEVSGGYSRVLVADGQVIGEQEALCFSEPNSLQEGEGLHSTQPNT